MGKGAAVSLSRKHYANAPRFGFQALRWAPAPLFTPRLGGKRLHGISFCSKYSSEEEENYHEGRTNHRGRTHIIVHFVACSHPERQCPLPVDIYEAAEVRSSLGDIIWLTPAFIYIHRVPAC